ncbi:pogo transposable element with ZNF domain [Salminus brasiliensis]|uniref:pogo transposable element with ZNF domain n=1 Tax=Salminus brasiliensis TaxID=930266 RepID=UPI003B835D0D
MEDADLFMECEEEELEPWQQLNQNEAAEESPGTAESKSAAGALGRVENPALSKPVVISSMPPASNSLSTVPLLTNTLPTAAPAGITKGAPGQQLILTQGAGGLTPLALSQVILPGSNAAGSQPIYLTTQGIPVQNIQSGQSPMSIVLNVQQGQAVRPITLVQAPGTPGIFKPAQIITQQAPMRPATPVVSRTQAPGPFTAVQIPATLTIRTTAPASQPRAKLVSTVPQASSSPRAIPINTQTKFVTVKAGEGNLDVQNLMSFMNSVSLPTMGQPQTFVVMSNQKANGAGPAAVQTSVPVAQTHTVQVTSATPLTHTCPRCKAKFKMIEALRGHMCFCCPDMSRSTSTDVPAAKPLPIHNKSFSAEVKSESMDVSPAEPQTRIVMLVDDFYYGTYEGNRIYVPSDNLKGPRSFKCLTCGKKLKNNIRLMNHMKFHVDVEAQTDEVDKHTSCPHCYRQFPSPSRLQCHVESVHNTLESTSRCKICEWAFDSEPVFLQHMKNTHKPGEMPYVCQVCEYRSSFYSDVHDHFRTWHEDTHFLLCIYCLKVFKHSSTYQQHFSRHQNSSVYHCNKCRLQFLFTKEKVEHKVNHHKTFRKPSQLEGLQAGTKVTIRAYAAKKNTGQVSSKTSKEPSCTANDKKTGQFGQASSAHTLNTKLLVPQSTAAGKKQISKMYDYLVKFQEHRALFGRQKCVECTFDIPDFANHYPTYVHCSLCLYSTCCSRAYANHMINNHVPGRIQKSRAKKGSVSWLTLTCACCNYKTTQGDLMAKHLVQFPDHHHCVFFMKECLETDIEYCQVEEEEEEEEEEEVEGPQVEGASVETKPDWLSMENWKVPGDGESVPEFTDSCGPQHFMGKSSDVLEYFQLLFPDTLIYKIVFETNAYAKYRRSLGRGDPTWYPLTNEEVKGFIGLCILMGVQCLPELEMYWSWKHYHSCTTFYRTMSATRFRQIRSHIRMSSMLAEDDNRHVGKLSFFQPMLKILETSMQEAYKPNRCLTIDRALLPTQEKGADREESTNSQPRIWLMCDSKSGYCHKLLILTKQEKDIDLGSLVVPYLVDSLEGKHHQVFISSLLASVPLMKKLHKKSIYCSSSIPARCPVLPMEFWSQPALESPGEFLQFEHSPVLFTRWKDAKEMICLSTNAGAGQPDTVWRKSSNKAGELSTISRPLAFKLLQDNMRGVDICNQLLACNQLGGLILDTNWRRLFWFLVNLSVINSFIILRETRKGNPPPWLQGGHFSQADYRKRLGYQLAKCAEREALQKKIANDRFQQRRYEGNPKIGFVEPKRECVLPAPDSSTSRSIHHGSSVDESATSLEASSMLDEDLDQELAPLEASDSDFETDDSSQQEPLRMEDEQSVSEPTAKATSPKTSKEKEETLTVRQLRILLFALCSGIQKAAKEMDTKPQLIRAWLRDKEKRLDHEGLGSSSREAIERLVEWVLVQREQQHTINETNLFQKASEVHVQTNQSSSFRISYEWAVNFMLQHKLGVQSPVLPCPQLPHSMEENCLHFTGFVQRQIQMHSVPHSAVGAMDELSIFVDFGAFVETTVTSRESAFRLEGTEKPWVNIYLSSLANGTILPTVLFFKGTPFRSFSKKLPDSLLLEARADGFSENEELEIWNSRVWQQHLNSQNGSKTILVMDGHHSHMSEGFVSTMSGTKTLPVIIPSGCTSQLQPLEMCVNPVLKKFLLARWSQLASEVTEVTPVDLAQLLVTWLEEFLACCSGRPELIKHSFCLSRVIAEQEECKKEANAQLELMNKLTEAMLGPEAVESELLSEDDSMETSVDGVVEANAGLINEKSHTADVVEQKGSEKADHAENKDAALTERNEIEQKAQESMKEGLEASSETSDTSSSLPSHTHPLSPAQVPEEEELLEPHQDSDSSLTDVESDS